MVYRIKDYARFQHFKDRNPPWIKLYRDILDDPDWHDLDAGSAKVLVMLWLIASEDETKHGRLPDNRRLCFRLRISEKELAQAIIKLSHWLEHDDIDAISNRYQGDAPERASEETEAEAEAEHRSPSVIKSADDGFVAFWQTYPKKAGKGAAERLWKKLKPDLPVVLEAIERAKESDQWRKDGGQFIPFPATWLNQRRWEDEPDTATASADTPDTKPKPGDKRTRHGAEEIFTDGAGWVPA